MMRVDFDHDDIPLWQTVLAWLVLLLLAWLWLACCVAPAARPIGEAMLKQIEKNKEQGK